MLHIRFDTMPHAQAGAGTHLGSPCKRTRVLRLECVLHCGFSCRQLQQHTCVGSSACSCITDIFECKFRRSPRSGTAVCPGDIHRTCGIILSLHREEMQRCAHRQPGFSKVLCAKEARSIRPNSALAARVLTTPLCQEQRFWRARRGALPVNSDTKSPRKTVPTSKQRQTVPLTGTDVTISSQI